MQPSGQGEWYVTYHRPHTVIATPMASCVDRPGSLAPGLVNEGGAPQLLGCGPGGGGIFLDI